MAMLTRRTKMDDDTVTELLKTVKANKWTLAWIAMVATSGFIIELVELVRG